MWCCSTLMPRMWRALVRCRRKHQQIEHVHNCGKQPPRTLKEMNLPVAAGAFKSRGVMGTEKDKRWSEEEDRDICRLVEGF